MCDQRHFRDNTKNYKAANKSFQFLTEKITYLYLVVIS